jgi:hypothetical protein
MRLHPRRRFPGRREPTRRREIERHIVELLEGVTQLGAEWLA